MLSPYSTFARISINVVKLSTRSRRTKSGPSIRTDPVLTAREYHDEPSDNEDAKKHTRAAKDRFSSSDPLKRGLEDASVVTKLGSPMFSSRQTTEGSKSQLRKEAVLKRQNALLRKSPNENQEAALLNPVDIRGQNLDAMSSKRSI